MCVVAGVAVVANIDLVVAVVADDAISKSFVRYCAFHGTKRFLSVLKFSLSAFSNDLTTEHIGLLSTLSFRC